MVRIAVLATYLVALVQPAILVGEVVCLAPGSGRPHVEAHHAACPQGEPETTGCPTGTSGGLQIRGGGPRCMDILLEHRALVRVAENSLRCPASAPSCHAALLTPGAESRRERTRLGFPGPSPPLVVQALLRSTVLLA
jgi:hypothetical protein